MTVSNPSIKQLLEQYKDISRIVKIKAVLEWDMNVNLPPKGAEGRARQVEYLANLLTSLWKKNEFLSALEKANASIDTLTEDEKAIVRNLNYANKYYQKVPAELIAEKEKVTAQAFMIWQKARSENSFRDFEPSLREIVKISREVANHLGYTDNPYDALLDLFEPGLTAKHTAEVFGTVKIALVDLIQKIQKSKHYETSTSLIDGKQTYSTSDQKRLSEFVMHRMGYDFVSGRMDVSAHPFTTNLDRYDVRITTQYKDHDFRDSYSSSVHETGHALYEQAVNPAYDETPLESGMSMGIHEAMSRFWENMVGKNPEFLRFMAPVFQSTYEQLGTVSDEEFVRVFNMVKPSFIRIEADEVTYSLHIILRFEMENALINAEIKPEDAAEAWREKSKELFGIAPKSDSEGVLQDVHWSNGYFGYFPSYALGNLYGAQLLHTMKKDVKFDTDLRHGELSGVREWLNKHIHQHGAKYWPGELIKKATGEELNPQYFIDYLNSKYATIYSL